MSQGNNVEKLVQDISILDRVEEKYPPEDVAYVKSIRDFTLGEYEQLLDKGYDSEQVTEILEGVMFDRYPELDHGLIIDFLRHCHLHYGC